MRHLRAGWITSLVCCVVTAPVGVCAARADVFLLRSGGQVRGQWVNREDRPTRRYEVVLEHGGRLVLNATQVREAITQADAQEAYERLAPATPDTAEEQWKLAEWCRERGLSKQRQLHLQRVLELDADHLGARRALGYSQIGGQWVTREEIQGQRGFEFHRGRWRYPQEIQLTEHQEQADRSEKEWLMRLRRCRSALDTDKAPQAHQEIAAVRDPLAVKALQQLLTEEPRRDVKLLYLDTLAAIGSPDAVQILVNVTLQDPDDEVFHASLDRMVKLKPPRAAKQYVTYLKDRNNVRLNRAACALGRLGEKSVLSPLIDALITTHYIVLPAKSDAYTATFSPSGASSPNSTPISPLGGTGFSAGDDRKAIPRTVNNQDVLEALIRLSGGVNFGFDKRAWRSWLANENRQSAPPTLGRRDGSP